MHVTLHDTKEINSNWTLNQNKCLYQATLYKSPWVRKNQRIICLKPVHDKVKSTRERATDGVSECMNFQSSSIFYMKLIITFCKLITESYHFQSLLPSCIKRFATKGEQTLPHFLFIYVEGGREKKKRGSQGYFRLARGGAKLFC